jgi:hypothetical protein
MTKPNVFIRGVYSTALTRMFLDLGYPIIFPSDEIQKRFNIPFRPPQTSYSKDITIKDRLDRQGISMMIKKSAWDWVEKHQKEFPLFQTYNPDLVVFKSRFNINSIYRGIVIRSNKQNNYSYIRLTPEEINQGQEEEDPFRTTLGRYARFLPDGKEGIFQVTHEDSGKNHAYLGSYYTIPGDLVVIVPYDSKVIISKEILNGRQKKRLFDLGKSIQQSKKYGFIFRTAAEIATDAEILDEVEKLEKDLIETQNIITKFPDRIGSIYENYISYNILFPAQVKAKFDKIRREVMPTLEYHHVLKSENVPKRHASEEEDEEPLEEEEALLEYTEQLMQEMPAETHTKINQFFWNKFLKSNYKDRTLIEIYHQKLNCKSLTLAPGFIHSKVFDPEHPFKITLKRRLREGGEYDGIGGFIENGDYAISEFEEGSWYYKTAYYSASNQLKGTYYNINTPIQIARSGVRYVDLEIDVVENIMGERKIIDRDLLERARELEIISAEVFDKALLIANNIKDGKI